MKKQITTTAPTKNTSTFAVIVYATLFVFLLFACMTVYTISRPAKIHCAFSNWKDLPAGQTWGPGLTKYPDNSDCSTEIPFATFVASAMTYQQGWNDGYGLNKNDYANGIAYGQQLVKDYLKDYPLIYCDDFAHEQAQKFPSLYCEARK